MCVYEALDQVVETLGAECIADYLFVNYPMFSDELRYHIEARIYLAIAENNSKCEYHKKEVKNEGNIKVGFESQSFYS